MNLRARLLEDDRDDHLPESKSSSTTAILLVFNNKNLVNQVASFLPEVKDYIALKSTSRVLYGPIATPNYAWNYAKKGYDAVESVCFMGECYYGVCCGGDYFAPIPCYTWGLECDYPYDYELGINKKNIPFCDKATTLKIKTAGNIVSCFTIESLRCACCVGKYSLGALSCCVRFFAGSIKKSFCSNIRKADNSLLLPFSRLSAAPKRQAM